MTPADDDSVKSGGVTAHVHRPVTTHFPVVATKKRRGDRRDRTGWPRHATPRRAAPRRAVAAAIHVEAARADHPMRRASELIICFNIKSAGCDLVRRHGGEWSGGRAHKQVAVVRTLSLCFVGCVPHSERGIRTRMVYTRELTSRRLGAREIALARARPRLHSRIRATPIIDGAI